MQNQSTISEHETLALSEFFRRKLAECQRQEANHRAIAQTIATYVCAPVICLADLQTQGENYKGMIEEYVHGAIASLEAINKASQNGELDLKRQFQ